MPSEEGQFSNGTITYYPSAPSPSLSAQSPSGPSAEYIEVVTNVNAAIKRAATIAKKKADEVALEQEIKNLEEFQRLPVRI